MGEPGTTRDLAEVERRLLALLDRHRPELVDGTIYGSVDEASIVRLGTTCSLTNGEELLVELIDPNDRPVSTMTAPASKEGRSVERIAPDAPDSADSYCFSRTDAQPTPGRQNSVVAAGCE